VLLATGNHLGLGWAQPAMAQVESWFRQRHDDRATICQMKKSTRRQAPMARTGYPADPVTARGQATRRLLAAAEEVFGDKGFERASIVDVTRGARGGAGDLLRLLHRQAGDLQRAGRRAGPRPAAPHRRGGRGIGDFLGMRWMPWEERDPPAPSPTR
jgi:hypothetical protein